MAHFSALLGKSDREAYYKDLSARIKEYFLATYFENGSLTMTTQTCCLLALAFDMIPKESVEDVIATLRRKIEDNNYTLSTGFVGTGILNQTLAKFGLNDLAYSLFLQTADPSWLYSVRQGATTIWERWNSYTKETGFGNVGMNSFNHYAYGAVAEWVMSSMIGIRPDENAPGFKKFILAPEPDTREFIPEGQRRIRRAKAHYDTEYGRIESAWEYVGDKIAYSFTIPAETTATVILALDGKEIQINDVKFKATELGTVENGKVTFVLGAGKYSII
jgi:alpha-L-rhamnosidase